MGGGPCFVNSTHDNCGRGRRRFDRSIFSSQVIGGFCVIKPGDKTGTNEENWFDSSTAFPHLGMVHFLEKTMVFMLEFTGRWQTIV